MREFHAELRNRGLELGKVDLTLVGIRNKLTEETLRRVCAISFP